MSRETLRAVYAEALFASRRMMSDPTDPDAVKAAIRDTIARLRVAGVVAFVATEFGDHPDTAVARMRWARTTVAAVFPPRQRRRHVVEATPAQTLVGAGR